MYCSSFLQCLLFRGSIVKKLKLPATVWFGPEEQYQNTCQNCKGDKGDNPRSPESLCSMGSLLVIHGPPDDHDWVRQAVGAKLEKHNWGHTSELPDMQHHRVCIYCKALWMFVNTCECLWFIWSWKRHHTCHPDKTTGTRSSCHQQLSDFNMISLPPSQKPIAALEQLRIDSMMRPISELHLRWSWKAKEYHPNQRQCKSPGLAICQNIKIGYWQMNHSKHAASFKSEST